jgi:gamma-glutamyltranspeptidase/glutathione hydrolase
MVASQSGIVASESVLASQVGARILESGGNAIDAAVATNAMMGLVAPMNDGIGGDLFAIVYVAKTGKLYGLNASGWAPAALTPDFLLAKGIKTMPQRGIHSVTVPGAVAGWDKLLKRFGTKTFADVLAPAIRYAEAGFPVGEVVSVYWHDSENVLREEAPTAKVYLPGGRLPAAGDVFQNRDLAWSYRQIATTGRDAFYKGTIAKKISCDIGCSRRHDEGRGPRRIPTEWSSRFPRRIAVDGVRTGRTGRGLPRSRCSTSWSAIPSGRWGSNSVRASHDDRGGRSSRTPT